MKKLICLVVFLSGCASQPCQVDTKNQVAGDAYMPGELAYCKNVQ